MATDNTAVQETNTKRTVVIITLICLSILISILFVLMLNYNIKIFVIMFCLYTLTYATYIFAILIISRKKNQGDFRYEIALYTSFFTMFFVICLGVIAMVMYRWVNAGNSPAYTSSSSYNTYRYG